MLPGAAKPVSAGVLVSNEASSIILSDQDTKAFHLMKCWWVLDFFFFQLCFNFFYYIICQFALKQIQLSCAKKLRNLFFFFNWGWGDNNLHSTCLWFEFCVYALDRNGDFADFSAFADFFSGGGGLANAVFWMGTYQLHVIACNLDLSRVGMKWNRPSQHKLLVFFSKSVPIRLEGSW